jgi:alkaline phosphatase
MPRCRFSSSFRKGFQGLHSGRFAIAAMGMLFLALLSGSPNAPAAQPKNVIVLVADGSGFNTYAAAAMYQGRWNDEQKRSAQVYDGPDWVRFGCTTYSLTVWAKANEDDRKHFGPGYEPEKVWKAGAGLGMPGNTLPCYRLQLMVPTDSAAAATAMATGVKVNNGALNWTRDFKPLLGKSLSEIAHAHGKSAGVVTTVPWCDATPAAFGGAHAGIRSEYAKIANEMLDGGWLQVIMGGGNPEFDNNGQPIAPDAASASLMPSKGDASSAKAKQEAKKAAAADSRFAGVGGRETWQKLQAGTHPGHWRLLQTKKDFEALSDGTLSDADKVIGIPQVARTLQQARGSYKAADKPFATKRNTNVPDLATMAKGAIRVLSRNDQGFFLMVEGGAVDWANHANQPARMIEEMVDFNQAVEAVARWVETSSNWDETLVIVTADHETGMLWGKNSDRIAFDPVGNRGKGEIPDLRYHSHQHTNSLTPMFARGPGAKQFAAIARGKDEKAAAAWKIPSAAVDNTDIFRVANGVLSKP